MNLRGLILVLLTGIYVPVHAIRAVKDKGNSSLRMDKEKVEVWSPTTTKIMRDLMSDVVLNGTGRGIPYTTSYTGAKTGTTESL